MKKKVLIIDDELDLCFLLKKYLTSKQYDVAMANSLKEGLQKVGDFKPDILFLDNNLPDGFGWEKASILSDVYPLMKINLMSGFKTSTPYGQNREEFKVIEKPISLNEVDNSLN